MLVKNKFLKLFLKKKGFTFVELLISVTLFSVTILSATGIFKMVTEGQRNAISSQIIQESFRYAFEIISKEMRSAQISDGSCKTLFSPEPTPVYGIFNTAVDAQGKDILYFKNKDDECVGYYLESDRLVINKDSNIGYIVPKNIKINNLKFIVSDNIIGNPDGFQAKVTIGMESEIIGKGINKQKTNIQTTVSSRNY